MSRQPKPPPKSPDDQRLLESANKLREQLGVSTSEFARIRWSEVAPSGQRLRQISSDQCYFWRKDVLLPARMLGKLTVEEWRPLMASSLIYEKKIMRALRWKLRSLTILPIAAVLVILLGLSILLGNFLVAIAFYLVIIILVNLATSRRRSLMLRNARLEADNQASTIVGKYRLLNVLKKVNAMGLKDIEDREIPLKRGLVRFLPTVKERIEHLQGRTSG
ncbi:MAG TPA: hypothetical protein VFE98_05065 [Candidatus Bathyarchaeia archaeon]|nr:hypothetical protein [Candidatus Bathyarchaeia archaeon]